MEITAKNLFTDKQDAIKYNKKFIIMASIEDCSYCHFVEDEVLKPMSNLSQYNETIIRKVNITPLEDIISFDNKEISTQQFGNGFSVNFYPTLLILDKNGKLLEKIIGVANDEFYWHELDVVLKKYS